MRWCQALLSTGLKQLCRNSSTCNKSFRNYRCFPVIAHLTHTGGPGCKQGWCLHDLAQKGQGPCLMLRSQTAALPLPGFKPSSHCMFPYSRKRPNHVPQSSVKKGLLRARFTEKLWIQNKTHLDMWAQSGSSVLFENCLFALRNSLQVNTATLVMWIVKLFLQRSSYKNFIRVWKHLWAPVFPLFWTYSAVINCVMLSRHKL